MLVNKYQFQYFKVDDYLNAYTEKGAKDGKPLLSKVSKMTLDELWLRNPDIQNQEELELYWEMFEYISADLKSRANGIPMVAEGAVFLPRIMNKIGIFQTNYICIVPTKQFQYEQYSKRTWVSHYLSGCSNKELAFENWIQRDYLFASAVLENAKKLGYHTLVVDGTRSIDENYLAVEKLFDL
ncbi:hypothetical protein [[Clostridium] fimetarium]|uniref:AAA domain-containing protein n=1 Tax=[Clostridium] fimetarium TaxID=99656 RepID=A0A1I0QUV7_9FIRM|nr:hypothetical protein [[Clostridium] fimetarium]SEW31344.1 hypothetical protein SAMN05421659_109140 [[Clostridium] fimetarium]